MKIMSVTLHEQIESLPEPDSAMMRAAYIEVEKARFTGSDATVGVSFGCNEAGNTIMMLCRDGSVLFRNDDGQLVPLPPHVSTLSFWKDFG